MYQFKLKKRLPQIHIDGIYDGGFENSVSHYTF